MLIAPNDIENYWSAAQLVVRGLSPYEFSNFYSEMQIPGYNPVVYPFNYPPPALFWFLPLALMDIELASVVWRLILIICYILAVTIIFKILNKKFSFDKKTLMLLIPTAICFPYYDWFWGNSNSIVFLLFALILRGLYYETPPLWIGLLVAGLGLKPHFFIPLGVCLAIQYFQQRKISFASGLLMGIAIQVIPVMLLCPQISESFFQSLPEISKMSRQFPGISISSALHAAFGFVNPVGMLLAALFFVGLILAFNRSELFAKAIFIMPIAIAISPHANIHAILFIAPAYWYLCCECSRNYYRTLVLSNFFMILVLLVSPFAHWDMLWDIPVYMIILMFAVLIFSIIGVRMLHRADAVVK